MVSMSGVILVVEDDAPLCDNIAEILQLSGYRVATARNGVEALQYLEDCGNPSLMLLDLMMPELDGWEVLRRVRAAASTSRIPVVILTAGIADGAEHESVRVLKKPFDVSQFLDVVKENVTRH